MSVQTQTEAAVMFSPRRIGHANLFVGELERSMRFYNSVAGFEEVFREPHIPAGFLSNGNTHHDLGLIQVQRGQPVVGRDGHVQIPDRGAASKPASTTSAGRWSARRIWPTPTFARSKPGSISTARSTTRSRTASTSSIPDGNLHEFYADMMDDWRKVFHGKEGEAITGGWDPEAGGHLTAGRYHRDFELRRVEDALIHPVRFTSAVLLTRNFEAMIDFYATVAGLDVRHRTPDGEIVCFAGAHANHGVDISLARQAGAPGVHHYSYEVAGEDELDRAEAALAGAGIAIDRKLDHATKRSLFVRDPDGMLCEFLVPRAMDAGAADVAGEDRLYLL